MGIKKELYEIFRKGSFNTLSIAMYRLSMLLLYILAGNSMETGVFAYATSVMTLVITFQMLGTSGVSNTFNRYTSKYINDIESLKQYHSPLIIILLSLMLILVIFMNGLIIVTTDGVFSKIDLHTQVMLSVFLFFTVFSSGIKGIFYAYQRFRSLLISSLFSSFFLIFSYVIFLNYSNLQPLFSLLGSVIIGAICEFLALIYMSKTLLKFDQKLCFKVDTLKELAAFALPSSLSSLIVAPVNVYLVDFVSQKSNDEGLATFNILIQIRNMIIFAPSAFASIALSSISQASNFLKEIRALCGFLFVAIVVTFIVTSVLMFFSKDVFSLYGINPISDPFVLFMLVTASSFLSVGSLFLGQYLTAKSKTKLGLYLNCIWALVIYIFLQIYVEPNTILHVLNGLIVSYSILLVLLIIAAIRIFHYEKNRHRNNMV